MPLHELDEQQLRQLAEADIGKAAILFTTPLCGTCKVAERMLEVAGAAGVDYPLYKTNINFTPYFRVQWQISSVPSLVVLRNGSILAKENAIRSVDHLYRLLKD